MAKTQPIGYFIGGVKGGFVGGIGLVESGMSKSKLWQSCQKGEISPDCRKGYQPMAITPAHTLQENWEDYVASGRTPSVHKTWEEHRGSLWNYKDALKEAEKITRDDRNEMEEDGKMEVMTSLEEQGTRERAVIHRTRERADTALEERTIHQEDNRTGKPRTGKERRKPTARTLTKRTRRRREENNGRVE